MDVLNGCSLVNSIKLLSIVATHTRFNDDVDSIQLIDVFMDSKFRSYTETNTRPISLSDHLSLMLQQFGIKKVKEEILEKLFVGVVEK
jgi:hypothetical protein